MRSGPLTIAVGIDHSDESFAAARWAAAATENRHGSMILIHSYAPPMFVQSMPGYRLDIAHDDAAQHVAALADELRLAHPDTAISTVVSPDPVVPLLTSASHDVDVLVLGHHRRGWTERLMGGSISCALSGMSQCPVVTVPFGSAPAHGPVSRAVDVDSPSDRAFEVAFDRASLTDRPIAVVCAIPDDLPPHDITTTFTRAENLLRPWRHDYPDVHVTVRLVPGPPHRALAEAVPTASLQIVTRPRVRMARTLWIRSVARAMQRRARCPIAVVEYASQS